MRLFEAIKPWRRSKWPVGGTALTCSHSERKSSVFAACSAADRAQSSERLELLFARVNGALCAHFLSGSFPHEECVLYMSQALNETWAARAAASFTGVRQSQSPQQHSRLDEQTKESESV